MTREEIIQGLQFTIDMFLSDPLTGEALEKPRNDMDKTTIDACKGAIELLKQAPCEDAISREDALDALHMCLSTNSYDDDVTGDSYICYEEAEYEIKKLPSVQPKPIECSDAISREQAIDAVADLFEMSEYPHPYSQGKPIRLKDIKEKLKQLPPVQPKPIECEDAISREDALMCMTGEFLPSVLYEPEDIISKRVQRIKALPSVRPKIKTGHWISYWDEEARCQVYKCPECGNKQPFDTKCCWECGTRLVEPQESEET